MDASIDEIFAAIDRASAKTRPVDPAPESLRRALDSSAVFRELFPSLTIFPLRPILPGPACDCAKGAGCDSVGKHPAVLWKQMAAGEKIKGRAAGCGYGIATGARSGVFVVDLDGVEAIERFFALGPVPETFTAGRDPDRAHLYFEEPDFAVKNSASQLAKKIDVRGDGGYAVAPGSPHKSGGVYKVVQDVAVAPAPPWLLAWSGLRRSRARTSARRGASKGGGAESFDPVEPVPLGTGAYARRRVTAAADYLRRAPLVCFVRGGQARPRRNVMFSIASALVWRMRLPIDAAADLIEAIYNPRLVEAGMVPWSREAPGDYGMSIVERLQRARDTGSDVPPGDIMSEETWLDLAKTLGTDEVGP